MEIPGASVVISHQIRHGKQHLYEDWLKEIEPACRNSVGHIDWQIIRPIPNLTFSYTVIIRYDTIENLKTWMESDTRKKLIQKATPFFAKKDNYTINSGLDFLFDTENKTAKSPVRWKQYLVTWSAIFPLSMLTPLAVIPILNKLNVLENKVVHSFFISGVIVFIMIYLLMPRYTKLIRNWLYN
ncbi:antibiotic biosynthesis monooxygenase [Flavobacterium magnum]|uniref:Antibiotic biosynthesis monooxygenase n=1 Tax=Flavobacterium magnum TaxID=2162713 RepID=A0A2S0RFY2_9FLAO|nr:antibiotic biosynthesis monooxygenase [Flavobacterium magnum]AWA30837.1 antibiotic biosynthesis monooxygenase [Flavobacterium magnum]